MDHRTVDDELVTGRPAQQCRRGPRWSDLTLDSPNLVAAVEIPGDQIGAVVDVDLQNRQRAVENR